MALSEHVCDTSEGEVEGKGPPQALALGVRCADPVAHYILTRRRGRSEKKRGKKKRKRVWATRRSWSVQDMREYLRGRAISKKGSDVKERMKKGSEGAGKVALDRRRWS